MYDGVRYKGDRSVEALEDFVLSKIKVDIKDISSKDWESFDDKQQWLLFLCGDDNVNCPERKTMKKLAVSLVILFILVSSLCVN